VLAAVALAGCTTGKPASTSSWQGSSDRTLGQAISGLGTARLVVEQEAGNHLLHTYAVVTATDAIETTSKEISSYLVGQPPDNLHAANQVVTTALQDAASLLVEVRVALASPGLTHAAGRALVKKIDAMRDRLDKLDSGVTASPGSVGTG
jgi:hypothetical protein